VGAGGASYYDPRQSLHPQQPSLSSPRPSFDDEHYYYVATMNNRQAAAGKHIPVTEL
jgi:hypothetical protein